MCMHVCCASVCVSGGDQYNTFGCVFILVITTVLFRLLLSVYKQYFVFTLCRLLDTIDNYTVLVLLEPTKVVFN